MSDIVSDNRKLTRLKMLAVFGLLRKGCSVFRVVTIGIRRNIKIIWIKFLFNQLSILLVGFHDFSKIHQLY